MGILQAALSLSSSVAQPEVFPPASVFTSCLSILGFCPSGSTNISLESQQTLGLSFTPNLLTEIPTPFPLSHSPNLSYFDAEENVVLYFLP